MTYTNSSLVSHTHLSPNNSGTRTYAIDRITPHCVVGQCTIESLGNLFANANYQASSNYGIGNDGRVGLFVEEKNRSWCSSSESNDQRAITIECASDDYAPYAFKTCVYEKLIELCTDICKRNGKTKLLWLGSKEKTLAYEPKADEMVLTAHRFFANKSCPGDWLYSRYDDLAQKVTAKLSGASTPTPAPAPSVSKTVNIDLPKLWKGMKSNSVRALQALLIDAGYSCGSMGADGDFGMCTYNALISFQKAKKIDVDGVCGVQTWTKLLKG